MESRLVGLSRPVVELEGIGPKLAADLKRLEVFTVGDLLRAEPTRLFAGLRVRRSLDDVRSWLHMAQFLQIRVMTTQWAEALVRAGVYTPRDLFGRDLAALRKLFRKARDEGVIPDVPDTAAMAEMLKEAAEIAFTGAVNGTILDQARKPVAGAEVRIGREQEQSDARGRFRIVGVPLWADSTLVISHPQCRTARFRVGRVAPSFALGRKAFVVGRLPAGERPRKRVLMAVRGDVLPPIGDARVGQREVERETLLDGDIFAVTEFSADRKRCKVSSKLLVYDDGEFWVQYVWMPVAELRHGVKSGDTFVLRRGGFERIEMNAMKLRGWPAMLRAKRALGPLPETADEIEAWLDRAGELLEQTTRPKGRF